MANCVFRLQFCGEEMILTATLQIFLETYGIGSVSCLHVHLSLSCCSAIRWWTIDHFYLSGLPYLVSVSSPSHPLAQTLPLLDRRWQKFVQYVTLAIDCHSFDSLNPFFVGSYWVTFIVLCAVHFTDVPTFHLIFLKLNLDSAVSAAHNWFPL